VKDIQVKDAAPATLSPTAAVSFSHVRGIAALWVFIGHLYVNPVYNMGYLSSEGLGWVHHLLFFHFLAVDVFLLQSGFLLYLGYREYFEQSNTSGQIDRFYLSRIARLYPLYLFVLALIGAYHVLGIPHPVSSGREAANFAHPWLTLLLNLLFMNAWGIVPVASWNDPSWTLSILMLLYVTFPNLVVLLRFAPSSPKKLLLLIYALLLAYYAARLAIPNLSHSDGTGAILRGFAFFIIGCLLARLYQSPEKLVFARWETVRIATLLLAAALMVGWHEVARFDMLGFHLLYPPLMLSLLYAKRGFSSKAAVTHLLSWFGTTSYSIYLLHYPACLLVTYLAGTLLQAHSVQHAVWDMWMTLPLICVIYGVAWLGWRMIEKPSHAFFTRHLRT
jgi:peptidoglycan/LPS O-acetylase OafA/YrhL